MDTFLLDCEPFPGAAELQARAAPQPGPALGYLAQAVTPKGDVLLRRRGKPSSPSDFRSAEAFVRTARETVAGNLETVRLPGRGDPRHTLEAQLGIAAADGGELVPAASALLSTRLPEWLSANASDALWSSVAPACRGCGACEAVCSMYAVRGPAPGASGAEPRPQRFPQRVMQNFCTYPRHFDAIACTGCGRCARVCEAGIRLPVVLGRLVQLAAGGSAPLPSAGTP